MPSSVVEVFKRKIQVPLRRFVCLNLALALGLGATMVPLRPATAANTVKAAIIVDANTGGVLYSRSADVRRSPASLTKIMTLYILFAYLRAGKITFDTEFVVTPHAAGQSPTKLGLKPGSTIKVSDAIKALVTKSANDAAATIAENLGGTEANFGSMMTKTAHKLGMKNTTFRNASGLPNKEQLTTARDMAILAMHIMRDYPEYYGVFETRYFTYKGRKYRNHNRLLFGYKGTNGIKTGYTRAAGFNLTASVQRGDKHLVGVVLGGRTGAKRDAALRALFDKHWHKASRGKPSVSSSLIASLLGSSSSSNPPPPSRKPAYALAAARTTMTPTAAARPVTLASAPAQGDASTPGDTVRASLSPNRAAPRGGTKPTQYAGTFHVQVGAYTSQSDAQNRLGMVQQRAPKILDGHMPFTAAFMRGNREWYRARFAGFSKSDARSACVALKRMSLDCIALAAE
ncbi:MAG: serine hydrolase [Hyphomicrobiaceae bacterium]|jgi:D-alanyl-D-alanine carboxypeptidase|nr:serine hydrolase [Methyloceanibacter sp.]MDX2316852.1 serine hydrolase [Hyphomicrobiaceae bacterium]MDX2448868.1 serine hydrolase [Hyphomicrobiaceae bacterium]